MVRQAPRVVTDRALADERPTLRYVGWKYQGRYFELAPLDGEREFVTPDSIAQQPNLPRWHMMLRKWDILRQKQLRSPRVPFVGQLNHREDDVPTHFQTRPQAISAWNAYFEDGAAVLAECLPELHDKYCVMVSIMMALATYQNNHPLNLQEKIHQQTKAVRRVARRPALAQQCVIGSEPVWFDWRKNKHISKRTSVPKFLSSGSLGNAEHIAAECGIVLDRLLLDNQYQTQRRKVLRNYVIAMEEAVMKFIIHRQANAMPNGDIMAAVLLLFAAHGMETVLDVENWRRALRRQKALAALPRV